MNTDSPAAYLADPRSWLQGGASIDWNGHRLFIRSEGQGAPLLLLHGFPTSSWDWKELWSELVAQYQVITFDYLGFGFSSKPSEGPYSVFAYADQAEAVLAHFGVKRTHLLAHDLGDTVAQELLARDLERRAGQRPMAIEPLSACLLNGGILPETHHPRVVQKLLDSPLGFLVAKLINRRMFEKSLAAVFGPSTQPSAHDLAGFWFCVSEGDGMRNTHRLIRYMRERRLYRERWVQPLIDGPVPFAMINGLLDPVSGVHVVERLRQLRPAAEIYELGDIGHYPQTEAPARVLQAYRQFADKVA